MGWNNNRLDFEALQHRYRNHGRANDLAVSEPAHFICFDVLQAASTTNATSRYPSAARY